MKNKIPFHVLPIIVFAQFAGTSMWFAGNAVALDLINELGLPLESLGYLTSSVQLGFISGTLVYAYFGIADRFSPSNVFLLSALLGAVGNLVILYSSGLLWIMLLSRLLTGFFLAGIYPVGMKIAADWHEKGLGLALGFLVGALVLGTAFPHFIASFTNGINYATVFKFTSGIAVVGGGLLFLFVGDGPHRVLAKNLLYIPFKALYHIRQLRSSAAGYFGHMWELYAFWAFIPIFIQAYLSYHELTQNVSLLSFIVISSGTIGCVAGGFLSLKIGSKKVATFTLFISGICCLLSPLSFHFPPELFYFYLIIWGATVVADSPQFSTLVAQTAPKEFKGSALTLVNSIGFGVTIFSIEFINYFKVSFDINYLFILLTFGPLFGLIQLFKFNKKEDLV